MGAILPLFNTPLGLPRASSSIFAMTPTQTNPVSHGHVAPMSHVDISHTPLRGVREICNRDKARPFAYARPPSPINSKDS